MNEHVGRVQGSGRPPAIPVVAADGDEAAAAGGLSIDCGSCAMQHTATCDDCVVTFICSRTPDDAVVVEVDEWRAVKMLQDAGLVPQLRHRSRTG